MNIRLGIRHFKLYMLLDIYQDTKDNPRISFLPITLQDSLLLGVVRYLLTDITNTKLVVSDAVTIFPSYLGHIKNQTVLILLKATLYSATLSLAHPRSHSRNLSFRSRLVLSRFRGTSYSTLSGRDPSSPSVSPTTRSPRRRLRLL